MSKTLIIIPAYNAESVIGRSIKSAAEQTLRSEVWVVDNLSTDNTRKTVREFQKKYKNVKLYVNKRNYGRVGNWNKCLELFEKSSFDYIKFLFTGDELFSNCIENIEKSFSIDPEIGAVSFLYEFVDLTGNKKITKEIVNHNKLFGIKEATYINLYYGGILGAIVNSVYSRKVIKKYRFNEMFIGKADFDYEILSRSKAYFINKALARFNLDSHRTFFRSQDYFTETEYAFIRGYHLEKNKELFTKNIYEKIRERIFIEFVTRNMNYYSLISLLRLFVAIMLKLPETLEARVIKFIHE